MAAAAAAGQVRQQKQPRPIAPAVSVTKATSTPGGGAPREQGMSGVSNNITCFFVLCVLS